MMFDTFEHVSRDALNTEAIPLNHECCKELKSLFSDVSFLLARHLGWHDGRIGTTIVPVDIDSPNVYQVKSDGSVIVVNLRTSFCVSMHGLSIDHDVINESSILLDSGGERCAQTRPCDGSMSSSSMTKVPSPGSGRE